MPRYHFHVHDGVSYRDKEGTELPGLPEVRREAMRLLSELFRSEAADRELGEDWRVEVTDNEGRVLLRIVIAMKVAGTAGSLGELVT